MKKQVLSFLAVAALAFTACNNDADTTATTDTTTTSTSTTTGTETATSTTTQTSSTDYAAFADSVERNSQQGYYLNPRTGKPYKSLRVDRTTGRVTDDAGEPVWRYVDNRNWWVYGDEGMDSSSNWSQVGEAKMEKDRLMYKGEGDKWEDYNTKWKVSDDGRKIKMKDADGNKIKIKQDEDGGTKIKVNDEKTKIDKDGNVKKD